MKWDKNSITNILAVIVGVLTVIGTALEQIPEGAEWYVWVGAVIGAVWLYFVGKPKK